MSVKYAEFSGLNLPSIEQEILAKWSANNAFEKSISLREGKKPFVFYEGPPSANGMPGIHHVISRTLKDMVCRYKTMQGFQVKRKGGWDTHGLPIELGVEKELGITKEDIGKKISVEDYNKKCREAVLRYKKEWDDITTKMGYWVDLNNPYVTFENNYIETLWWILSELYKKGFLYESVSIQPYSPAAGTGLSSHELNQPGTYKEVKDTSAVVMFKAIKNDKSKLLFDALGEQLATGPNDPEIFFLAWTTTPWTLPSNLGLTVGPNITYQLIKTKNPYTGITINVILTRDKFTSYFAYENSFDVGMATTPDGDTMEGPILIGNKIRVFEILAEFKGSVIEGVKYEQLMPFANVNNQFKINLQSHEIKSTKGSIEEIENAKNDNLKNNKIVAEERDSFKIVVDSFVTTEDGTGIVHTAPAFGADDFRVGKLEKNNLGIIYLVDKRGRFLKGIKDDIFLYGEEYVKEAYLTDAEKEVEFQKQKQILEKHGKVKDLKKYLSVDDRIMLKLQEEGKLFKKEKYEHSYPHCWRTDKPILYYPLDAWFIKTTAVKDRMVELNKTINWKPKSTGEGRFGNWLENLVDWNLSRSRYWGTPLPIWKTEDGDEAICIGSIAELNEGIKKANTILGEGVNKNYLHEGILDLHKPYVDDIILVSSLGKPMKRVPDLIDVWFDSGAMPYAQWHYPFENKELIDKGEAFPADFIAEGVDQTRGWFYTLHALAVMLFDSVAYKAVVSNGLVLDKNGNKMSKRLGNVVNPFETIEKYGADATRWYLITNASPWDNLKFDLSGIQEVQRKFFGTLYNTYQFFTLYANVDGFAFKEAYIPLNERPEIDRWILSALNTLVKKVTDSMDDFEPTMAGRAIEEFVDAQLSNWYVRLCRRRFWKGEYETDKISAYQTLYECLETVVRLVAPISPFFSDAVFANLNAVSKRYDATSVHHIDFPVYKKEVVDPFLEDRMLLAQETCSLVLSLRKKVNIKVRQPLQRIMIPVMNAQMKVQLEKMEELIKAEVNVKEIEYITETAGVINKKVKANFKTLGAKLGASMKEAAAIILSFDQAQIGQIEQNGQFTLELSSGSYLIDLTDVEIVAEDIPGWSVASKGALTVALDITLSEALKQEGEAREFVNRIQNIRKESGYELTDRIFVSVQENSAIQISIIKYNDYICREILADKIDWVPLINDGISIEVNEIKLNVIVNKKG